MDLLVLELNHVALHVNDLDTSIEFYKNKLNFPTIARPDFDFRGAWFALGNQQLHLIEGHKVPADSHSRGNHFAVRVKSIKEAEKFLANQAVYYNGPKRRPDGAFQIFVVDPDGYHIEFCEL